MHPQLTPIVAQQHTADLRRAADHHRLVQAATTASRSDAPTSGRPVAAAPVTLIRRLRRRLAHTHPTAR
jgi:hypothetical protein